MQDNDRSAKTNVKAEKIYEELRNNLDERYNNLKQFVNNFNEQISIMETKKQELAILTNIDRMFKESGTNKSQLVDGIAEDQLIDEMDGDNSKGNKLTYFAGLVNTEKVLKLKRKIHRATFGMCYMKHMSVNMDDAAMSDLNTNFYKSNSFVDPKTKKTIQKSLIFICIMNTETSAARGNPAARKIRNAFEDSDTPTFSMSINLADQGALDAEIGRTTVFLADQIPILRKSIEAIENSIMDEFSLGASGVSKIEEDRLNVLRHALINDSILYLNHKEAQEDNTLLIGNLWVPERCKNLFFESMNYLCSENTSIQKPECETKDTAKMRKPTSFLENDLSYPFNMAVETYAVPTFGEINPGLFTIATFPFLFGVMFGDFGHGLCFFIFG